MEGLAQPQKAPKPVIQPQKAGQANVIGIHPANVELDSTPGGQLSTVLKVDNPTSTTAYVSIEVFGFVPTPEGLLRKELVALAPTTLARNVTLETQDLEVPPFSFKNVNVQVKVPEVLMGTQYAGLSVTRVSQKQFDFKRTDEHTKNVGVGMQPAIVMTVKVHITGTLNYGYAIKDFQMIPAQGNQPLSAKGRFVNTGNGELVLLPVLILFDGQKKPVARFKTDRRVLLEPGVEKEITFAPTSRLVSPGKYTAVISNSNPKFQLSPIEQVVEVK
jgi:hypothetical protein